MNLDLRNSEGYIDLTAYEAIKNASKNQELEHKDIVYVCSPFNGDIQKNKNRARGYCRFVKFKGYIPIAVHLLFPQFMDECNKSDRKSAINMGLEILSRCDELWCFGSNLSEGMIAELTFAKKYRIKIRYFTSRCEEILA